MIFRVMGGLADQLYVYAAAKSFSLETGEPIYYDRASYFVDKKRKYELEHFKVDWHHVSMVDEIYYNYHYKKRTRQPIIYYEGDYFALNDLKNVKEKYVVGGFHSRHYYEKIKPELQKLFMPCVSSRILKYGEKIASENSVALHVRRGDIVNTEGYVVQNIDYYARAIEMVNKKSKHLVYYVFSNDLKWCANNLEIKDAIFVGGNSTVEDFYLMRCCRHHITGNSGFSWWPAYLATEDSIKISPKRWFTNDELNSKVVRTTLEGFELL